ncbi:hypothetical protein SARC_01525 [Sphaeroforma arctica JP610]|uniref:Uncharacterized protein n=1 Tax=Sphaeroforma arctica JP610 TaxID=667725 RepID=A0A0L0GBR1_9EUKA|nr:hypothetical protein SARC_01525 [Sphaeroforma arctica JP610]KNC86331.1 hypothetical protein SARC_01525 [Sphaeroforma arctica JP610]|eukprot:XP_014160233.1 hypothetical protein SARC_01525 [Sphaeroforma arctica JP610]
MAFVKDRRRPTGPPVSVIPPSVTDKKESQPLLSKTTGSIQRAEGRGLKQLRPVFTKVGTTPLANGSAYGEMGNTKCVAVVHGPREYKGDYSEDAVLNCEFRYDSVSQPTLRANDKSAQENEYSIMLANALSNCIQREAYPKSVIDIVVTILDDDGGAFAVALTTASLALAHAGLQMYDLAASVSVAVVGQCVITDPTDEELAQSNGHVTVGYLPQLNEICSIVQEGQLSPQVSSGAIEQCIDSCAQMYFVIQETLKNHNEAEAEQ